MNVYDYCINDSTTQAARCHFNKNRLFAPFGCLNFPLRSSDIIASRSDALISSFVLTSVWQPEAILAFHVEWLTIFQDAAQCLHRRRILENPSRLGILIFGQGTLSSF